MCLLKWNFPYKTEFFFVILHSFLPVHIATRLYSYLIFYVIVLEMLNKNYVTKNPFCKRKHIRAKKILAVPWSSRRMLYVPLFACTYTIWSPNKGPQEYLLLLFIKKRLWVICHWCIGTWWMVVKVILLSSLFALLQDFIFLWYFMTNILMRSNTTSHVEYEQLAVTMLYGIWI